MADLCLTCGHQHRHHSGLANMIDCDIPGCSCTKFEPADPKIEQTQGGDAHDLSDSSPGNRRAGADVTGPAVASSPATAGPPDLQQAIHAATVALRDHDPAIGLSDPWAKVARIAIEAAYPLLLHATRDRHAALEVQIAELKDTLAELFDLLHVMTLSSKERASVNVRDPQVIEARVRAVLQTDGPARGHAILQEIQRLRTFKGDIRAALRPGRWRGFDGPDGISKDEVIADVVGALTALDQAAQREVDDG